MTLEFQPWPKIARLNRDIVITEKLDGTNAAVHIDENGKLVAVQSRQRFITPEDDNYGFARYVHANKEMFEALGHGVHFGEWWGQGIQRGYGLKEKRFSLFNTNRWTKETTPEGLHVVPVLWTGGWNDGNGGTSTIEAMVEHLRTNGSVASGNGFEAEGIIIYHTAANLYFKVTLKDDEKPKGQI